MKQSIASFAHELNDSIAATILNAETALRWLEHQPPDAEKTQQAINRIVANGKRAAGIIQGLRELAKKAPMQRRPRKAAKRYRKLSD